MGTEPFSLLDVALKKFPKMSVNLQGYPVAGGSSGAGAGVGVGSSRGGGSKRGRGRGRGVDVDIAAASRGRGGGRGRSRGAHSMRITSHIAADAAAGVGYIAT